jgi:hypothetical protein
VSVLTDTERAAFEVYFSDNGQYPKAVQRSGDGYLLAQAQSAWGVWQARAKATTPIAEVIESGDHEARIRWILNPLPVGSILHEVAHPSVDPSDTEMLDWLGTQEASYGFEDVHEGNRWQVEGPYLTLRDAIRAAMKVPLYGKRAALGGVGAPACVNAGIVLVRQSAASGDYQKVSNMWAATHLLTPLTKLSDHIHTRTEL